MICVLFTGSTSALTHEIRRWASLAPMRATQEGERNETGVITAGSAMPRGVPRTADSHSSEVGGSWIKRFVSSHFFKKPIN